MEFQTPNYSFHGNKRDFSTFKHEFSRQNHFYTTAETRSNPPRSTRILTELENQIDSRRNKENKHSERSHQMVRYLSTNFHYFPKESILLPDFPAGLTKLPDKRGEEGHGSLLFTLPGEDSLTREAPLRERFLFKRLRLSNTMEFRGGACKAPSTQSPTCLQPQGLDVPSSEKVLNLGKLLLTRELILCSGESSSSILAHTGQGGSLLCILKVVCSKHSAWKTWWHDRIPATGRSPLRTIRRELQGDLCERNLLHSPHR